MIIQNYAKNGFDTIISADNAITKGKIMQETSIEDLEKRAFHWEPRTHAEMIAEIQRVCEQKIENNKKPVNHLYAKAQEAMAISLLKIINNENPYRTPK